ncbi:hypothetical protein [Hydrogenophaga sp.]|uniref:hypothetical protein n=1 Tax=Hydrogenophaga sp. TaxID=1904254 RepID=UPI00261C0479|nr:hypothetical protein [Hydrogenophaga sp.]MCW5654936.1 hypothetical protein [Hydrogenophaga sp.]
MHPLQRLQPRTPALLLATVLLLAPVAGGAESSFTSPSRGTSASLDFRIVIPPVMQLLENSHPSRLDPARDGAFSAQQKLVVVSNLKRGFCLSMRMAAPEVAAWRLQTSQIGGVTLNEVADGYRLCTARAGRYTLMLQHDFSASPGQAAQAMAWPVQTDLVAL